MPKDIAIRLPDGAGYVFRLNGLHYTFSEAMQYLHCVFDRPEDTVEYLRLLISDYCE